MSERALRFGIQTPPTRPWRDLLAFWRTVEALGFDSAWLPDHLVPPFRPEWPLLEAWTLLAALADGTERIRLGVLVSCNTFRHPPLVAKEAVTIDHISSGRLELGLGAGWFAPEHAMFGIPLPETNELVGRFREAVELVDLLLRQERTTYTGTYYQTRDALMRPAPLQQPRPPLTLGAHGPRMMRIVATHADRWNSTGSVAEMRERVASLHAACAAIGRDPRTVIHSHLYVPALMPDERPWDSPDAFADFIGRLREAGLDEFILQPTPDLAPALFERIALDVIPALRAS